VAQAVRWGWLARNPVSAATRPPVPRTTVTPPEADDVRFLLALAERHDAVLACWLHIAVATGARRGEVCALCWSDVDLEAATVRIARSVSATKSAGVAIRPTKTGCVRLVSLTAPAVEALLRHRTRSEKVAASTGRAVDPDDQIFTGDPQARRPWRPELATRRWERLRARSGLGHMRIHDLRHFVATQLLTAGIDVRTVANRLGHARTSTTLDIYWAWVPARDRDAARHIEAILG
jgi:integrase